MHFQRKIILGSALREPWSTSWQRFATLTSNCSKSMEKWKFYPQVTKRQIPVRINCFVGKREQKDAQDYTASIFYRSDEGPTVKELKQKDPSKRLNSKQIAGTQAVSDLWVSNLSWPHLDSAQAIAHQYCSQCSESGCRFLSWQKAEDEKSLKRTQITNPCLRIDIDSFAEFGWAGCLLRKVCLCNEAQTKPWGLTDLTKEPHFGIDLLNLYW